ncbi:uncharacterized protein METZ01_LOCUS305406, partial [marine metagenome]
HEALGCSAECRRGNLGWVCLRRGGHSQIARSGPSQHQRRLAGCGPM